MLALIARLAATTPLSVKPLLRVFDQICETELMPLQKEKEESVSAMIAGQAW